ncbi:MAG: hypothetical protein M3Q63_02350 [bacterium]|nr:hypothetical protein [bacterium]
METSKTNDFSAEQIPDSGNEAIPKTAEVKPENPEVLVADRGTRQQASEDRLSDLEAELGISDLEYGSTAITALSELEKIMAERYGNDFFHNPEHVREFEESAVDILNTISSIDPSLIDENDELTVRTIARGHDLVVNYLISCDPKSFQFGQRMRIRGWGIGDVPPNLQEAVSEDFQGNEKESAEETKEILQKIDPDWKVFTKEMYPKIDAGIAATYPVAGMAPINPEYLTIKDEAGQDLDLRPYLVKNKEGKEEGLKFDQKYLTAESPISTLASGLADLSYVGKVSPEGFKSAGNAEYKELRERLRFEHERGAAVMTPDQKAKIAKDMLGWIESQLGFAIHQKVRFDEVVNSNQVINGSPKAEEIKNALKKMYSNFDINILAAKERIIEARETFSKLKDTGIYPQADDLFNELLVEMGY